MTVARAVRPALDGGINLSQIGGYVPAYLAPQTIISAINVTGSFSTVSGFQVTPNKFWVVTYNSNSVALTAALPGDANLDNTVNLTDFTFLAANFNTSNQDWFHGDFNYDHHVDLTDFTFLAANFNQTVTAPSSLGTVVPEPAASLLSLLAVSMGFGSRQRRRHAL